MSWLCELQTYADKLSDMYPSIPSFGHRLHDSNRGLNSRGQYAGCPHGGEGGVGGGGAVGLGRPVRKWCRLPMRVCMVHKTSGRKNKTGKESSLNTRLAR